MTAEQGPDPQELCEGIEEAEFNAELERGRQIEAGQES
jgi:hypothetical protein